MRCPHCGNMIGEADIYCPFCNEQVDEANLADIHQERLLDEPDDDIDDIDADEDYQSGPDDFDNDIDEDEIW